MGNLHNTLHKSITVKNLLLVGVDVSSMWGLGTTRCQGITTMFIAQMCWTNFYPLPLDFLSSKIKVLTETSTRDNDTLSLYNLFMDFMPWRASLPIRYWLIMGRSSEWSIWMLMGDVLWVVPMSVGDFPIRKVIADSLGTNYQCFQNRLLVPSETKQVKDIKGSFNSSGWLLWWLLPNSRIISPFWKKQFQHYTSLRSLKLING